MNIETISLPELRTKIKDFLSHFGPEYKYELLKDLGAKISYEEFIRKEYINYWNEE